MLQHLAVIVGEDIDVAQALHDVRFLGIGGIGDPHRLTAFDVQVALGGAPFFFQGSARVIVHPELQSFLEQQPDADQQHAEEQNVA